MKKLFKYLPNILGVVAFWLVIFLLVTGPFNEVLKVQKENVLIEETKIEENNNNNIIEHKYLLNQNMKITSKYILSINNKIPPIIADIIAYEIHTNSQISCIPVPLIVGIMQKESAFNPMAISSVGAKGLMQVYDGGNIHIDDEQVFDIQYNIAKGLEIFHEHMRLKKGDLNKALYGYVGGSNEYADFVYRYMGQYIMFTFNELSKLYEDMSEEEEILEDVEEIQTGD